MKLFGVFLVCATLLSAACDGSWTVSPAGTGSSCSIVTTGGRQYAAIVVRASAFEAEALTALVTFSDDAGRTVRVQPLSAVASAFAPAQFPVSIEALVPMPLGATDAGITTRELRAQ